MFIVGQKQNRNMIDNGGLDNANFIIIKGPINYGKTYLTKYIASHFKMDYILLDNKVETIRSLVESSNKENNCLYHLKDFDKARPAAKAALLKIAEETPKGVKIVVTTSAYNFLETLTSRAYVISIEPYFAEDIEEYNKVLGLSEELLSIMKDNFRIIPTPTILYNYKEREDIMEIFDLVQSTIDSINNGLKLEDISRIANNFWKDDREKVIIFLQTLSKAHRLLTKNYYDITSLVQDTLYKLNKITITNYRQLIHNMLMEAV